MSLVRIASFRDPHAAHVARGVLESAGIDARVLDEHLIGVDWTTSQALGGVKLVVAPDDADTARALLAGTVEAGGEAGTEANADPQLEPRCPRCASAVESLASLDRRLRALGMLIPLPFTIGRYWLRCRDCGRSWRAVPRQRGVFRLLADLCALLALAVWAVLALPIRLFRVRLAPRTFGCWSCGGELRRGSAACPTCGIGLPSADRYRRFVRRGRAYDGACASCHLPFAHADYLPGGPRRCSGCGAGLPPAP